MPKKFFVLEDKDINGAFYGIYQDSLKNNPLKRKFYFRNNNVNSESNAHQLANIYAEGYYDGLVAKEIPA